MGFSMSDTAGRRVAFEKFRLFAEAAAEMFVGFKAGKVGPSDVAALRSQLDELEAKLTVLEVVSGD